MQFLQNLLFTLVSLAVLWRPKYLSHHNCVGHDNETFSPCIYITSAAVLVVWYPSSHLFYPDFCLSLIYTELILPTSVWRSKQCSFLLFHCCYSFFAAALAVKPWMQHVSVCSVMLLMSGCKTLPELEAQKVSSVQTWSSLAVAVLCWVVCAFCVSDICRMVSVASHHAFVMRSSATQHKPSLLSHTNLF